MLNLFTQIKTFSITAEDFLSKNSYSGKGNVETKSKNNSAIIKCSGKWKDKHNHVSSFIFSYRFIFEANEISIEHIRYGEESPVYLCKLKQVDKNIFKSIEPHVCNKDLYSAELLIDDNSIFLSWKITGPKKDMVLNYVFS